ncbi:MAG: glycerol-3-phosphate responsive antiterminator [Thermotogae bacterium]|jgi:glycerol uptake operon antiterminator|nr:glycerol-3-phosphate responsive antiterminator [Thermotogota bacterium]
MSVKEVIERLKVNPVIPAIRRSEDVKIICHLQDRVVFLLETSLNEYRDQIDTLKQSGHKVFVHLDLIKGLKSDPAGLDFILKENKPDGIISTHKTILDIAKKYGLIRIHRIFMIDSEALISGQQLVQSVHPDFVEILPGLALIAIEEDELKRFSFPLIAGGLVTTKAQVNALTARGVVAVSTSKNFLW